MGSKGEQTREHILSVAERLILERGYSGTSIEHILQEAGITKGGFFYHFDGKNELARQLIRRYLRQDQELFDSLLARARDLTDDPLEQLLVFLKLYAGVMADIPGAHPGCLVASFTYESQLIDDEVRELTAQGMRSWQEFFGGMLQRAADRYPVRTDDPIDRLADMLTSILEGAIVTSRCLHDAEVVPRQLLLYRDYLRTVFGHAGARSGAAA